MQSSPSRPARWPPPQGMGPLPAACCGRGASAAPIPPPCLRRPSPWLATTTAEGRRDSTTAREMCRRSRPPMASLSSLTTRSTSPGRHPISGPASRTCGSRCQANLATRARRPSWRRSAGYASTPRRCTRVRSGARGDDRCPRRPPSVVLPPAPKRRDLRVLRRTDCHWRRRQHRAAVAGGHRGGAGVLAGADGRRRGARPHRAADVLRRL
mmetsp:Transcript_34443/g.115014  ORF Transcript_34443/g.115014 Transcript_34443/m.115014 type:complete len:211 (+) Transcript_34443:1073-1705(+)